MTSKPHSVQAALAEFHRTGSASSYSQLCEGIVELVEQLQARESVAGDLWETEQKVAHLEAQLEAAYAEIAKLRRWFGMTEQDSSRTTEPS